MIHSVTLVGPDVGRMPGSDVVAEAVMSGIDRALGRSVLYELATYAPERVTRSYSGRIFPLRVRTWNLSAGALGLPLLRSTRRTDLTVIAGIELSDRAFLNPWRNPLGALSLILTERSRKRAPLIVAGCSVGSVSTSMGRRALHALGARAECLLCTDRESMRALAELGIPSEKLAFVGPPILSAPRAEAWRIDTLLAAHGIDSNRPFIVCAPSIAGGEKSLAEEKLGLLLRGALDRAQSALGVPVVLLAYDSGDERLVSTVQGHLLPARRCPVLRRADLSIAETRGVIAQAALLTTMQLDTFLLALADRTPVVGVCGGAERAAGPTESFIRAVRLTGLSDVLMSFESLSSDALARHILRGYDRRRELRARMDERLPALADDTLAACARALERGESVEQAMVSASSKRNVIELRAVSGDTSG